MHSIIIDVTPIQAANWLESNKFNRKISDVSVSRYARDMTNGHWTLNHQGIAFDDEGVLVDGQHRLMAIVKSGVTVKMMVTWGADRVGIDELRVRSAADVIKFGRLSDWIEKKHIEIAKQMLALCTASSKSTVYSTSDLVDFANKNKEAIIFSHNLFTKHQESIDTAAARAVIATASYYYNKSDLKEFVETLYSGVTTSSERGAAVRCRDMMKEKSFSGGAMHRRVATYKMMRAIKAFCERQPLKALVTQTAPAFTVPEDRI
jgi:hypothetical protein